jgi:molybdate transport system ATP-binding protein
VPQHGLLFPHLDVRRNIEYGSATSGEAALLARHFGVEHLLERATGELSGGERQLVALCRALAARPHVLLMDEPVSALDPRRRNDVLSRFAALRAERSITVLHVTHVESRMPHETLHLEMIDGTVSVATTGSY